MQPPVSLEAQCDIKINESINCLDGLVRIAEAQKLNAAAGLLRAVAAQLEDVVAERSSGASDDGGAATRGSAEPE